VLGREEHWLGKPSATFHGRDVFAPVAAALAMGTPPEQVGAAVQDPIRWEVPAPVCSEDGEQGEILFVDGFGNCVTNFRPPLPVPVSFRAGAHAIEGPASHYAAAAAGAPLVVLGSLGFYEIAVNGGNAARVLGLSQGDPVHLDEAS
jgi:S-adenosylmethionine hydrolase